MEGDADYIRDRFRLEVALEARRFEIELFWRRAVFFWGFIAAAAAGMAWAYRDHPRMAIAFSCFGLVCSSAWTFANRGSRFWHVNWERKVHDIEDSVIGPMFKTPATSSVEPKMWWSAKRYSVSRLTIALSDFVVLVWVAALLYQAVQTLLFPWIPTARNLGIVAFIVISVAYVLLMKFRTDKHGEDVPKSPRPDSRDHPRDPA